MELCNCNHYFDGYGGIYLQRNNPDVYTIYQAKNTANENKIINILNDFILIKKNEVNQLFLEYIRNNVPNEIEEKKIYIDNITQIIVLYNLYNKVIIRFPHKTMSCKPNPLLQMEQIEYPTDTSENKKNNSTKIIHNDRLIDDFIMFVDKPNSNLNESVKLQNQYINVIAHELGHSVDEKYDSNRFNDGVYIIDREIFAWNKAVAFLNELGIFNTEIGKQKEICVNNYRKKFYYYE